MAIQTTRKSILAAVAFTVLATNGMVGTTSSAQAGVANMNITTAVISDQGIQPIKVHSRRYRRHSHNHHGHGHGHHCFWKTKKFHDYWGNHYYKKIKVCYR